MPSPKGYITSQGLAHLANYKYVSGGYTKLDYIINPFWQWIVSKVPLWVAPNLITFIGFICVVASPLVMLAHSSSLKGDVPSWCFFLTAICIFLYSTLDAIDGKQARRTKSSSPLGQLFDHGCDSFCMTFFILGIAQAGKLDSMCAVSLLTGIQMLIWTSNWIEKHTGVLQTKIGEVGVTEGQYLCALIQIVTGIMGQDFWCFPIQTLFFFVDLPPWLGDLKFTVLGPYVFSALMYSASIYAFFANIFKLKNKLSGIAQFFSFALVVSMEFLWLEFTFYEQFEGPILMNFGILISMLVSKTIISSVTNMQLEYFHNEVMAFLAASTILTVLQFVGEYEKMKWVFWVCLLINLLTSFIFLFRVTNQLCEHLGIYCFSLQKRANSKET